MAFSAATISAIASPAMPEEAFMVGNNHLLMEIKEKLTNNSNAKREVVSITGMGGIGKTTLAKKVYADIFESHFDIRGWVTVSQSYSSRDTLLRLLQSLIPGYVPSQEEQSEIFKLKEKIYQTLLGMRYFIVIDDIWSTDAWDDMQICFSEQQTGSRILLTTRLMNVANHASSGGVNYSMPTLSEEESWDLFDKIVSERKSFPCDDEFKKMGNDIVKRCKGLPLAIVVIAGVLSNAKQDLEEWKTIAEDVKAVLLTSVKEPNFEEIFSLSYKHLPDDLKTCFLYLGVFPEDYEFPVRLIVRYWAAGEFLKVEASKREEAARQSLQDLMDRNLILVEKRGPSGKMKTCKMHDVIHEMCSRLGKEKNILHVIDDKAARQSLSSISNYFLKRRHWSQPSIKPRQENEYCWVSLHSIPHNCNHMYQLGIDDITLHKCHSFLVSSSLPISPNTNLSLNYIQFKSVKILDLLQFVLPFLPSPQEMDNLCHLRYLSLTVKVVPQSFPIFNLKKLQMFTLRRISGPKLLHFTISKALELIHLCFLGGTLLFSDVEKNSVLEKLKTVSGLSVSYCMNRELMVKIPNVKKLWVKSDAEDYKTNIHAIDLLCNLSHLHQLQNLSYNGPSTFIQFSHQPMLKNDFPSKLKKLTFQWTWMEWKMMTILGRLPNLEVLNLKMQAFVDSEWEQTEKGFQRLRVLVLEWLSLQSWIDTDYSFPRLERLVLKHCYSLKTLPYDCLSSSPCLKLIDLERCKTAILVSAEQIKDDGDGMLEVRASNIVEVTFLLISILGKSPSFLHRSPTQSPMFQIIRVDPRIFSEVTEMVPPVK